MEVQLLDSTGEKQIFFKTYTDKMNCIVINQSKSCINNIGLGWMETDEFGRLTGNSFYYTFNTNVFTALKDKRRLFFLNLLSDKEFVNSLKTGLSFMSDKKNKDSLVVINLEKNAIDSTQYDFLTSLTNWVFEKFDKRFCESFYENNSKSYILDQDKDLNSSFQPYDNTYEIETAVYDKDGNYSVKKSGTIEYMPIVEILLGFGRKTENGEKRELFTGASKTLSTAAGVTLGNTNIYLKQPEYKKRADAFNETLLDYLTSIYE
ncbi:MAG: hypothetical protein FGM46_07465 [Ferruginibacter sp.]|nr:hypothetical protein [Ferruginibacter sp.]